MRQRDRTFGLLIMAVAVIFVYLVIQSLKSIERERKDIEEQFTE